MARFFVPISEDDFRAKLRASLSRNPTLTDEFEPPELAQMTEEYLAGCALQYDALAKVAQDISKIEFDLENAYTSKNEVGYTGDRTVDFCGINTLPNGLVYLGVYAGGDWEVPVRFIVYYDGAAFRGYVPTNGNTWNLKTKTAYGSEPSGVSVPEDQRRQFDYDDLIADIQARIVSK